VLIALVAGATAYRNTVMPNGECNVTAEDGLKAVPAVREVTHRIPTAFNPHYGTHVVVVGRDSKLYHKHQVSAEVGSNWSAWKCITPDLTKIPCSSAPACHGYDNNPAIAMQPVNGTLVVFARQMDDLTVHEFHLEDVTDPDSWSDIRGPACLCNFPPCDGQTKCGASAQCSNDGPDCSKTPSSLRSYWNVGPCFPTSELTLVAEGDKLSMYYRGFDGGYYKTQQETAGDVGGKFGGYLHLGPIDDPNGAIE